jgi:hypothetical protein
MEEGAPRAVQEGGSSYSISVASTTWGSHASGRESGVLITRLSAIEEAAAMDVLCSDKTGTFVSAPLPVVLLLFTNDFVTMSVAADRVSFSPQPDCWRIRTLVDFLKVRIFTGLGIR